MNYRDYDAIDNIDSRRWIREKYPIDTHVVIMTTRGGSTNFRQGTVVDIDAYDNIDVETDSGYFISVRERDIIGTTFELGLERPYTPLHFRATSPDPIDNTVEK